MARRRLPGPIFRYIDGAADDEVTYRRNTEAYERCDLVPNVLAGVESIDMSTTVMGQKLKMPLFCSPTALQRLFHHDGERAVAKAAEKFGTMFGVSSLGTVSVEEIGSAISTPKLFQLYFHKDRGLTGSMIERCIAANFDVLALTVDTITGGNRERDLRTGFTSPPRLTLKSLLSFAVHPRWAVNYFTHEKFALPQLKDYVKEGSNVSVSVGDYFSTMLDQSMNWKDAESVRKKWGKQFCLKGIMSVADAKRALDIGATAIMVSNHGGRQLDGSRSPFDQLAEIIDAVGDRIDVICDGGIRRGTHVLKALSLGAKATTSSAVKIGGISLPGFSLQAPVSNLFRSPASSLPGVIPEIDIWRAARLMLKRYGEKAEAESAARSDELAAAGDWKGAATWRRIMDAVLQLANKTPPGPVH
jgi:L-lactate dehydrogenase (cytochrome)